MKTSKEYAGAVENLGDGATIAASGVTAIHFSDGYTFLDDIYEPIHAEPEHFATVDGKAVYQHVWSCADTMPADEIPEAWLIGADGSAARCIFAEPVKIGTPPKEEDEAEVAQHPGNPHVDAPEWVEEAVNDGSTDYVEIEVGRLAF